MISMLHIYDIDTYLPCQKESQRQHMPVPTATKYDIYVTYLSYRYLPTYLQIIYVGSLIFVTFF